MLLIVDGNNIAYRAAFTLSLSHKGVDMSVTFGVLNMINTMLKKHNPRAIIVCWDGSIPYYRRHLMPQYKMHRKRSDDVDWDDIKRQMNELHETILPVHGIMSVKSKHAEADDLMAQAARMAYNQSYIVTTDKDLLQCVSAKTSVLNPTKGTIYSYDNFEALIGFPPEYYLLYKILMGDSSDNVPGIKGIGSKTAYKMTRELINILDDPYNYSEIIGILPTLKSLNKTQRANLINTGEDVWYRMHDVMDLWTDRVGAKITLITTEWREIKPSFRIQMIKKLYLSKGFISMLEDSNARTFSTLTPPPLFKRIRSPAPIVERMYDDNSC